MDSAPQTTVFDEPMQRPLTRLNRGGPGEFRELGFWRGRKQHLESLLAT